MLAYNGSIPGPTMEVQNGSGVTVDVENQGDVRRAVTH
jgi:FtsP/CotA-like multicopper oxidase with cupredoxin domain